MALDSIQEILYKSEDWGKPFWEVVRLTDMELRQVSKEDSLEKMRFTWRSMVEASDGYTGERRSRSGLVGGDGRRMRDYLENENSKPIGGVLMGEAIAEALAMGESNACMRKIVAAPTAGACGVMPAVLIPLYRREQIPEEEILKALYVASGIGAVIAYKACISGASGGCQAEIGTAAAMSAGALVSLRGGNAAQIAHAAAIALKNLMGLICDPVAGLVEVPCVKRNVIGTVNAISAADMALAGIESRIPVDQVIEAMGDVGRRLPMEFRETALGGLAITPFGREQKERLNRARERSDDVQQ